MIFQYTWQAVLEGRKTQDRRLVKPGDILEKRRYWPYIPETHILQLVETVSLSSGGHIEKRRLKWQVGKSYAVQTEFGKTNLYQYSNYHLRWDSIHDTGSPELGSTYEQAKQVYGKDWRGKMLGYPNSWHAVRIRITGIRQEHVQDISEEDAIAEGCEPVWCPSCNGQATRQGIGMGVDPNNPYGEPLPIPIEIPCEYCQGVGAMASPKEVYEELWNESHTTPGTRWEDNPLVWVLEFELVKEV